MRTGGIICDHCRRNLSDTENRVDFLVQVMSSVIWGPIDSPGRGDDPVPHTLHFCGWNCLACFADAKRTDLVTLTPQKEIARD